ncbi:hypothetical protein Avbf_00720 [Armadillidium vulgare]|nr:hypothetical protein Avbf_00720 [Armadillidium vulgare]
MLNRISHLEKSLKENEEHTENLSYKLSEALMEIEDKERIIKHFGKMGSEFGPMDGGVASEPCSINYAASKTLNGKEPRSINGAFRRK